MRVARCGEAPLPPPFLPGVFTGDEAAVAHELAGSVKPCEIPQFGDQGDGSSERDPTPRLECFPHRRPAPGLDQGLQFRFPALPPCGLLGHARTYLEDNLLAGVGQTTSANHQEAVVHPPGLIANVLAE
jgi:hypothetical protein